MCESCKKKQKTYWRKSNYNQNYGSYYSWTRSCWLLESKIQFLGGSNSIVVEEAARNFLSPRPSIKQSGAPNFFVQHDKVDDSKLRRYLETCGRALEQFLHRQTSSNDSILYCLFTQYAVRPTGKGTNIITWACAVGFPYPPPLLRNIAETNRHAICSILVYRMWW